MAYILDEPSIGLHQRDNDKLLGALMNLKNLGNTLIVVEHDEDTMRAADYIVDVGRERLARRGDSGSRLVKGHYKVQKITHRSISERQNKDTGATGEAQAKRIYHDKRSQGE